MINKKTFIDKNTNLFGSFSINPGNNGCKFFNEYFDKHGINAIYKSFKVENIENGIISAKTLNIKGFAVSSPHKQTIIKYLDFCDDSVNEIGACNTVINYKNKLFGYNTDFIAVREYLLSFNNKLGPKKMYILGSGGYSKTVQYVCKLLDIHFILIKRANWDSLFNLKETIIFNCTPVENLDLKIDSSNVFIDCIPTTESGLILSGKQAEKQLELYLSL